MTESSNLTAEPEVSPDYCEKHQSPMHWCECWSCGGEGYRELFDEDPLWYDEDDIETCDICAGAGGYFVCSSCAPEHDND